MDINSDSLYTVLSESVNVKNNTIKFNIPGVFDKRNKYMAQYNGSHELLKIYEKSHNLKGIKRELCKLWYIYLLVTRDIKDNKNVKESQKIKAFVVSDFKKYLHIVLKEEPDFDFGSYFEKSDLYDQAISITPDTINTIKAFISAIIL